MSYSENAPYATNIFPYAASAMSYDPDIQRDPTPSVKYMAEDVSSRSELGYEVVRDWFRDSWKYLHHGTVVLNTCNLRGQRKHS